MLQIMYNLGFPTDCIEVTRDLYTGAANRYQTPYGPTPPVQVDRGTMQGDTLSPFLFLLYIEPLLRWLNAGGRGYAFGSSVPAADREQTRCASLAYTDDLQLLTSSLGDMVVQTQKLTEYSDWAQMKVNAGKTFALGVLHNTAANFGGHKHVAAKLQRQLRRITVQGQSLACLAPDDPFLYLGVTMTLTLNWRHNFDNVMAKAKEQAEALYRSLATGGQIVKLAETVLRPGIASSFSVAPFTPMQIKLLDSVMVGVYKRAYRQRRSTPTAAVHEDPSRFGMGCTSLLVGYAHESTKQLTEAYNDGGAYGIITRSLLRQQARALGGLDAGELGTVAMRHLRIHQLSAMRDGNLRLVNMEASKSVNLEGTDLYRIIAAIYPRERLRGSTLRM
jgi:hypothetical protein